MKKMQVVLDREKILREGRYSPEALQACVDDLFVNKNRLVKGEDGFYYPNDHEDGFVGFMRCALSLGEADFFLDNVETWLWYNSDDYPEECCVEDAKEFFLSKRAKAVAI